MCLCAWTGSIRSSKILRIFYYVQIKLLRSYCVSIYHLYQFNIYHTRIHHIYRYLNLIKINCWELRKSTWYDALIILEDPGLWYSIIQTMFHWPPLNSMEMHSFLLHWLDLLYMLLLEWNKGSKEKYSSIRIYIRIKTIQTTRFHFLKWLAVNSTEQVWKKKIKTSYFAQWYTITKML